MTRELDTVAPLLDELPAGASVAVVTLLGSLCPITRGHVAAFEEARRQMRAGSGRLEPFQECIGFISLNGDT